MDAAGVTGAARLEGIAREFKEAGRGDLRKDLLRGIRETNKPTIAKIRANARATLPSRGGLAAIVATSKIGTRSRLSGASVGVEIKATTNRVTLEGLDRGRLRHPVFATKAWVGQAVNPGFFSDPIKGDLDNIRRGIDRVMEQTANEIERG